MSNVTLAFLMLIFSLIAGCPASIGFASASALASSWSDSFGAVILQLLNLATQLIELHMFKRLKHARMVGESRLAIFGQYNHRTSVAGNRLTSRSSGRVARSKDRPWLRQF